MLLSLSLVSLTPAPATHRLEATPATIAYGYYWSEAAPVLRIASGDMLLCQFRFDDALLLNLLSNHDRDNQAARIHATILAASQPVGRLA